MNHTPGPWDVGHYDKCTVWTINDFEAQRLQIANCKYLDQQFGEDIREETRAEAEANARLIAAAPQLLEALEWLDTAIMPDERKYDRNGWGRIHKQTLREFDRKVKAAIAATKEKER